MDDDIEEIPEEWWRDPLISLSDRFPQPVRFREEEGQLMKPRLTKETKCCLCGLGFSPKERDSADLLREGWAHIMCVQNKLLRGGYRRVTN